MLATVNITVWVWLLYDAKLAVFLSAQIVCDPHSASCTWCLVVLLVFVRLKR